MRLGGTISMASTGGAPASRRTRALGRRTSNGRMARGTVCAGSTRGGAIASGSVALGTLGRTVFFMGVATIFVRKSSNLELTLRGACVVSRTVLELRGAWPCPRTSARVFDVSRRRLRACSELDGARCGRRWRLRQSGGVLERARLASGTHGGTRDATRESLHLVSYPGTRRRKLVAGRYGLRYQTRAG